MHDFKTSNLSDPTWVTHRLHQFYTNLILCKKKKYFLKDAIVIFIFIRTCFLCEHTISAQNTARISTFHANVLNCQSHAYEFHFPPSDSWTVNSCLSLTEEGILSTFLWGGSVQAV